MTQARTQLDALTGMRGIAAWFVVLYHIRSAFPDAVGDQAIAVLAKGYLAVDLFFVLSGFVMWLTYGAIFQREGLGAAPQFLWRRLARIYPLHAFTLLATLAYALALTWAGKSDPAQYPMAELPLHAALVQNWGLTDRLSWNDPSWSISAELAAYLLLPPVAALLFRKDWPPLACLAGVTGLSLALHGWFVLQGDGNLGAEIVRNGLPRCVAGFFAGVLVAMAWRAEKGRRTHPALAAAIAGFAAWCTGLCPEMLAIPFSFSAFVYWLASTSAARGNPLASRLAVHLGDVSYSTYLGHFLLWIVFKHLFVEDPANVPLPLIGLYLVGVYLSSVVLYRLVEAPGRQFLQSLGRKGTSPAVA